LETKRKNPKKEKKEEKIKPRKRRDARRKFHWFDSKVNKG
jgi:hypothetical protein